ncbi:hypothetical protein [Enterobacter cloacae complex sp. 2025EL-00065]|uniref:hypothetical protein n=1 Tax=Enterobacter cloacae complex sp. 2025EL-00065 TaxID=3415634 RepID=UPI003C760CD5
MSKKSHILSLFILIIAAFIFGRSTYVEYLAWYYGSDNLVFNEVNIALLSSLFNGLYFALSASIIYASLMLLKRIPKNIVASCLLQFCINIGLYTLFVAVERGYSKLHTLGSGAKEGANKQVISSQADSLIKISRIWADFFPANTSNQPI